MSEITITQVLLCVLFTILLVALVCMKDPYEEESDCIKEETLRLARETKAIADETLYIFQQISSNNRKN